METTRVAGIEIFYAAEEQTAANLVERTCAQTVHLIRHHWQLETPPDCRVYVMTAWLPFLFHAAPWYWWPIITLSLPLSYRRIQNLWAYVGGWMQRYGRRTAVGVKPPHVLQQAEESIGEQIFIQETTPEDKVQNIVCHELTHAFTAHLKLPLWLNEGLAMLTVDLLFEKTTVKPETLEALQHAKGQTEGQSYRELHRVDSVAYVYHYARSYWLTRYLHETQPALLPQLLTRRYKYQDMKERIAQAYAMSTEEFWNNLSTILPEHFQSAPTAQSLSYTDLQHLQNSPYEQVASELEQLSWQPGTHTQLADLQITQWVNPDPEGAHLTLEHGPGYENAVIYQPIAENAFQEATRDINTTALVLKDQKTLSRSIYGGVFKFKCYHGAQGQVVILGKPAPDTTAHRYLIIVTTIDNVDALWFESDYVK